MKVINDFKFTLNVSNEGYTDKKEAIACLSSAGSKAINKNKMAFKEQTITTKEFLNLAVTGHSFCNLFQYESDKKYWIKNKKGQSYLMYPEYQRGANKGCMKVCFKADEFFKSGQVVFLDIDYTNYTSVSDYIEALTFKPTCVYMSYSDNILKKDVAQKENPLYTEDGIVSRRFRMVYVFNEQLTKDQLNTVSEIINNQIELDTNEEIQDKCGVKVSQYFNGCFGNNETYNTNVIYNYSDFSKYIVYNDIDKEEDNQISQEEQNITTTYYNELQKNDHPVIDEKVEEPIAEVVEDKHLVDINLANDMFRLSYDEFMKYNRHKFQYIYRKEGAEWVNNTYQFTDQDYFSLYYNVSRLTDGQKRRKKIFERMCLRRVINPEVTPETILFDAYEDVHRFFNNDDQVLSVDCLIRNVEAAFKLSIEEIEEKYSDNIAYLKSRRPKIILKQGLAFKVAERNKELKNIRYSLIDEVYNTELSVKENLQYINDNVFSICEKTLYNYCKDRGIDTGVSKKISDEEIMSYYDFDLSIRKNLAMIKSYGIKVSYGKLAAMVKKYNEPEPITEESVAVEIETVTPSEPVEVKEPSFNIDLDFTNMFEKEEVINKPVKTEDIDYSVFKPDFGNMLSSNSIYNIL